MPLIDAPRDLLLDLDNDLVVTTDLQFTRGIPAIVQSCRIALQMFKGEWFLDLDAGIPYFEDILGAKPTIGAAVARQEFLRELQLVEGVVEVTRLNITFEPTTRTLTVRWQVQTAFGETPIDTLTIEVA